MELVVRSLGFVRDAYDFPFVAFLKTPEPVALWSMLMGLYLVVYSLGQRSLRQAIERAKQTIENQVGKPTAKLTCSVGV